jgi:GDPmannose 4,6-dehydratase
LGTGEVHTVREFVTEAFRNISMVVHWEGTGLEETGISESGEVLVRVSPKFYRPLESDNYCANSKKAYEKMIWNPKVRFAELVKTMVQNDLAVD